MAASRKSRGGVNVLSTKDSMAKKLAESHASAEDTITQVIRIVSSDEAVETEPIKLLEVNTMTVPSGVVPISFGPDAEIPFPSVVVDVTPEELRRIRSRDLKLPAGWKLGDVIVSREHD